MHGMAKKTDDSISVSQTAIKRTISSILFNTFIAGDTLTLLTYINGTDNDICEISSFSVISCASSLYFALSLSIFIPSSSLSA